MDYGIFVGPVSIPANNFFNIEFPHIQNFGLEENVWCLTGFI